MSSGVWPDHETWHPLGVGGVDDWGQSGVGDINGDIGKLFLLKYSSHLALSYLNIRLRYYESCINPMIHKMLTFTTANIHIVFFSSKQHYKKMHKQNFYQQLCYLSNDPHFYGTIVSSDTLSPP